jgi:Golgi nucleoside diphosphatase
MVRGPLNGTVYEQTKPDYRKSHFEGVARTLNSAKKELSERDFQFIVSMFCKYFQSINKNFKPNRFKQACEGK